MKKRLLWKIAALTVVILAIFEIIAGCIIFSTLADINSRVKQSVDYLENIKIPTPKDGKDATMEQINQSVSSYIASNPIKNGVDGKNATDEQVQNAVNNYMAAHPVHNGTDGTDGKDGTNGVDGLTPEIQCNILKNRWEVRYSPTESWQLLNGQVTKCTISTEEGE